MDTASLDHIGNVIRRQVLEEFPDLTLIYIVYKTGQQDKALKSKTQEIKNHPAGEVFLPVLEKIAAQDSAPPQLVGLSTEREKKLLSFLAKEQTLACLFINADEFETPEDARLHATALIWHVLYIYEEQRKGNDSAFIIKGEIAVPRLKGTKGLYHNMLADVFATILLEAQGNKGSIQKLARNRSLAALTPQKDFRPELYPFLLAYDATKVVFQDLGSSVQKARQIRQSVLLTREIGQTFEEPDMRQWQAFTGAAQEMAWMEVNKQIILGAAVYTSEDPYVRATAHIVAEALNIEPTLVSNLEVLNPFADQEVNERYHNKACETAYQDVAALVEAENDSLFFIREAGKQNNALLKGYTIGWCAYGLIRAADAYDSAELKTRDSMEDAHNVFLQACNEIPWDSLREMNQIIMDMRKSGEEITPGRVIDIAKTNAALFAFVHALSISAEQPPPPEEEEPEEGGADDESAAGEEAPKAGNLRFE